MNTRFNPTANGNSANGILHVGHLAVIMANEYIAHRTGGVFTLRFDDNQKGWVQLLGRNAIAENCLEIINELEWLGIKIDRVSYHSELSKTVDPLVKRFFPSVEEPMAHSIVPHVARVPKLVQYPYAPYLTAEIVAMDAMEGIDVVITGEDLLDRWALYQWMCERMGYRQPDHIFLPRMQTFLREELVNVSKTNGSGKIKELKNAGLSAEEIKREVRGICLINPSGGWWKENIKPLWALTPWSMAKTHEKQFHA